MIDVLQSLQQSALASNAFPATSRYYGIGTAMHTTADGRVVAYVQRRFLAPGDRFTVVREHTVREGDRLDNLAANYLGDPEQFWRICDANVAMNPPELTADPGSVIAIALPEGYGGAAGA